jgi:hypothetical protein
MTLNLEQASEVLRRYYEGQIWRCAEPVDTIPPQYDEYGNILAGIDWNKDNDLPVPSMEELQEKWEEIAATGEYKQSWDEPRDVGGGGVFYGTTSQYAQRLLTLSDWAALPDTNLANQAEWDAYRAALRDIRSNPSADKTFPEKPAVIFS